MTAPTPDTITLTRAQYERDLVDARRDSYGKVRRPGKGPVPRGAVQRREEEGHARRLAALASGPLVRIAEHAPVQGSLDFLERLWARVGPSDANGCMVWLGNVDDGRGGYGKLSTRRGGAILAHRTVVEIATGQQLPSSVHCCHSCDNPPCCNLEHLFQGTRFDNMQDAARKGRMMQQKKTHCPRGHPLSGSNLYLNMCRGRGPYRVCRECTLARQRAKYRLKHPLTQDEPHKCS